MASGLLNTLLVRTLAATIAVSTTGCLALEQPPYIGDFPVEPTVNHPPVILESLVEPQRGGKPLVVKVGENCTLSFKIRVFDTDVDDELFVRWYVDYDKDSNNGTVEFKRIQPNDAIPGQARQAVRNQLSEYIPRLGAAGGGFGLAKPGDHIVEAMVADSDQFTVREEAFQPSEPGVRGPSPRTTYAWFIRSEVASCP